MSSDELGQFHLNVYTAIKSELLQDKIKNGLPPFKLSPKDSYNPSYTNLVLPYRVICRQRYHLAGVKQKAQFIREIRDHELLQSKALDGVRIHREFCNPVLSKPKPNEMIRLTDKQKMKIEEILARNY
ncbi:uncharacterized protein LOC114324476 [Diabrotica virgifera virgifera]|uniref:Uncharacterized protein LOC114324476 n=1 Tax=Diabrotica virgifera virgifera TaxID=50390 RepID=A0A6P7EZW9_DIAVI|nr:uncharacterized protein LOC114324476 [Diabrotica virgifera virgifera]